LKMGSTRFIKVDSFREGEPDLTTGPGAPAEPARGPAEEIPAAVEKVAEPHRPGDGPQDGDGQPNNKFVITKEEKEEARQGEERVTMAEREKEEGEEREEDQDDEVSSWFADIKERVHERPAVLSLPFAGAVILLYLVVSLVGGKAETQPTAALLKAEMPSFETPKIREEPYTLSEVQMALSKAESKQSLRPPDYAARPKDKKNQQPRVVLIREKADKKKPAGVAKRAKRRIRPKKPVAVVPDEPPEPEETRTVIRRTSAGIVVEQVPVPRRKETSTAAYGPAGFAKREEKKQNEKTGSSPLSVGATMKAALQVGISSAFRGAPVLARLTEPVRKDKVVLLPAGSTLTGNMSAGEKRIFINFHKATSRAGKSVTFRGYAVSGKLPGIPAAVTETEKPQDSSYVAKGALRTAQTAILGISGSVAQDLVRNTASEGLEDAQRGVYKSSSRILELAAGTKFEVVVTGD